MLEQLTDRGDTIVEVLIAMVILAFAFAISYSTANAALIKSQNSQEHSLALEDLDAQVEALRYYYVNEGDPTPVPSPAFCLSPASSTITVVPISTTFLSYLSNHDLTKLASYPSVCAPKEGGGFTEGGFSYYLYIQQTSTYNFTFTVTWPGLGSLGWQQEQLFYRVYPNA